MDTLDETEATRIVDGYAGSTLAATGRSAYQEGGVAPSPCVGRVGESSERVYTMIGAYQLLVPSAEQPALLDAVRTAWVAAGCVVVSERRFADGGGELRATAPGQQVRLTLASGEPPAMLLLISTGCHLRPMPST